MKKKRKGNSPKVIFILLAFAFSAFSCQHKNIAGNNGGKITWQQTALDSLRILAINSANGDIFAGIQYVGVYRSTDNGESWTRTALKNQTVESLVINSNGHIFAGSGSYHTIDPEGVFYSKDHGESWTQINHGLTNTNLFVLALDSEDYLYAGSYGDGVFRTVKSTTL